MNRLSTRTLARWGLGALLLGGLWAGNQALRLAGESCGSRGLVVIPGVLLGMGLTIGFAVSSIRSSSVSNPDGSLLSQQLSLALWRIRANLSRDPKEAWFQFGVQAPGPTLAHTCLAKAAALGHAEACLQLGLMAEKTPLGMGHIEALPWFRRAAERGSLEGAFRLAEALRWNREAPPVVLAWYLRAAQGGFPPAMARLGLLLENGDGVPADPKAAQQWRQRHAALPPAQVSAATTPSPEPTPWFERLLRHPAVAWVLGFGLCAWVLFWLLFLVSFMLTFGRFAPSMFFMLLPGAAGLAILGYSLRPLTRHSTMGRKHARLLDRAQQGEAEAAHRMGLSYLQGGPGHPKDTLEARRWFGIAAEAGHPEAMFQLSELMAWGAGGLRDTAGAATWLARSAAAGCPAAVAKSMAKAVIPNPDRD